MEWTSCRCRVCRHRRGCGWRSIGADVAVAVGIVTGWGSSRALSRAEWQWLEQSCWRGQQLGCWAGLLQPGPVQALQKVNRGFVVGLLSS